MNRLRVLLLYLLVLAPSGPAAVAESSSNRPPNIVVILADDLGWTDGGFAGSRFYETPNLDALAGTGMRFTSFYSAHSGAATRASLLTGEYSPRSGVYAVDTLAPGDPATRKLVPPANRSGLAPGTTTLAAVLKAAGYATGFIGQWQLGADAEAMPSKFGFDEVVLCSDKYVAFQVQPPAEVPAGTYLTDYVADRAGDFATRHKDAPFLLMVSHLAVRAPPDAKPALLAHFEKKAPAGGHRDAAYAALIASLDESVGRLVSKLKELQLDGQTLIVFTSDNGGVGGYPESENGGRRMGLTDNAPLRGGQGTFYEGGLRVPFLVRWPGVVPAGTRTTQPCAHIDLLPTLCEVAGTRAPTNHVVDGISLLPLLRDAGAHLGRDAIFWHFPGYVEAYGRPGWRTTPLGVIRAGNFKLIEFFEDGRLELYNVVEDLGEKNNLVRSLPEKAHELQAKLAAWRKSVNAPMPEPKAGAPAPAPAPAAAAKQRP